MPAFSEDTLSDAQLSNDRRTSSPIRPGAGADLRAEGQALLRPVRLSVARQQRPPADRPPWAELVAYDLNEGTIKWRVPLGTVVARRQGITNTGSYRPTRNGPVVTAGGLIFIATAVRPHTSAPTTRTTAKSSGSGRSHRTRMVFPPSTKWPAASTSPSTPATVAATPASPGTPASPKAQGYYVFALPKK